MKPELKLAAERCDAVALACETVTKSVMLAGTDMRDHASDIRLLIDAAKSLPTGTELEVCRDIAARQNHGQKKYGTTVAENPLKIEQWAQHAYEESLDFPIYLKRLIGEALAMRVRLEQMQSQDADARDALCEAGYAVLSESEAPADGIRLMKGERDSLVALITDLKNGIRNVGEQLHEITSYAENERTIAIAHGLHDAINTMLACTTAVAGAELERLRAEHKTRLSLACELQSDVNTLRAQLATAEAHLVDLRNGADFWKRNTTTRRTPTPRGLPSGALPRLACRRWKTHSKPNASG